MIDDRDDVPSLNLVYSALRVDSYDWNSNSIVADCALLIDDSRSQVSLHLTNLLKERLHCLHLNYSNYYSFVRVYCRSTCLWDTDLDIHWR